MPEYLAPGVYVEEVDTGAKPIEGVSTSTAGVVGMTERGPLNVPVLVTSIGEFQRIFGDQLERALFTVGTRSHNYLPHAVEGYFTNRGRRLFVTRVAPQAAEHSERMLFDRGGAGLVESNLLRAAPADTGTAVLPPALYLENNAGLVNNDWLRVGTGSRAEYHRVDAAGATTHVAAAVPLVRSHDAGVVVNTYARVTIGGAGGTVIADTAAGEVSVGVTVGAPPVVGGVIEIGDPAVAELREITLVDTIDAGAGQYRVHFEGATTFEHGAATPVEMLDTGAVVDTATLDVAAEAGSSLVFAAGLAASAYLQIVHPTDPDEYVRVGALGELEMTVGAYQDLRRGTRVEVVSVTRQVVAEPNATDLTLDDVTGVREGTLLRYNGIDLAVTAVVGSNVTVTPAHGGPGIAPAPVTRQAKALTGDVTVGSVVLPLDNRVDLAEGMLLQVGDEVLTVADIPGERSAVAPDAGNVILTHPVRAEHAAGDGVIPLFTPIMVAGRTPAFTVLDTDEDADELLVGDAGTQVVGDVLRFTASGNQVSYHRLANNNGAPAGAAEVALQTSLGGAHERGVAVAERRPLLRIRALDAGGWGNRLRVSIEDEPRGLASRAELHNLNVAGQQLWLTTLTGVEAGTVLVIEDADGNPVGDLLKVRSTDPSNNNEVRLDVGLTGVHAAAHAAAVAAGTRLRVRSREFRITVHLLRRPDPAVPSRNDTVIDTEVFRHLSMDHRHSRYVRTIVGGITLVAGEELRLWDRRTPGQSRYVRVEDQAASDAAREAIRLGPETLTDLLATGRARSARHPLFGGDDAVATIAPEPLADAMYAGTDNIEPELRTGLFSLNNEQDISLVAVPGQTTVGVQQALVDHCENDRYRFAVLDGQGPPNDALADVQAQRQSFDTRYAAMYHPWLLIPDPSPTNVINIEPVAIPPSGHVLGVYARTDNDRGVHKAPANEVVRGIVGLQRGLNKGEQDVLNPSPVNINVIRDFRLNSRGLRIWGARCITSDTDFKYVNVRRLLIFLEKSIDRGLQWVVFEPNAEPTWARVRRAITNFLTVVWRNGALEGTKPEEGFFVKCDRTTMTQTDIDNGRLICRVGIAPVKPAEFVIIRIGLWTANASE